jgi:hypothetical protein
MRAEKEKQGALEITKRRGVAIWHKRDFKWMVDFGFNGKERYLGYFDDHTEAVAVYSSYGWTGQRSGSGLSDEARATLGVFASLVDRF